MLANLGILASARALVPAVVPAPERDRHAAFLADKLLLAFAALGAAPLFLAARGAPTPVESLLFVAMLTPGAATLVVARTGRLALGHAVAAAGFAAIGLTLLLGLGAGAGVAVAWLMAAALEIAASRDPDLRRRGALVLGGGLALIGAAGFDPRFAPAVPHGDAAMLAGLAALVGALTLWRLCAATGRLEAAAAAHMARAEAIDRAQGRVILDLDADGSLRTLSAPPASPLAADPTLIGRGLFDRVHVADRPAFLTLIDGAAHGPETTVGRFRLRIDEIDSAGSSHLSLEMRARRLSAAQGTGEVVAILEDVSERHVQASELAASRRAVAGALLAKDQFMTTMSHELRTPLNAIIGFADRLASRTTRPDDVAKQCEFARIIGQSGRHLLQVVNAVLDVSRLQSGTYPMQPEPFDAVALLDQSIEAVAAPARERAVRLRRDYPATLEQTVGDKRALKAALVALLANAVKFSPADGEVTLRAHPRGTALVVTVADAGIGIAAEDLTRLGQPFFQASGSTARPFEGAGLGLALVRGIVGLHGGGLAVESEAGFGTLVTLRLPLDCRVVAPCADLEIETFPRRRLRPHGPTHVKDAA